MKIPFDKVKFNLSAVLFLAMALGLSMPVQAAAGDTPRASLDSSGAQADGGDSPYPSITAFTSEGSGGEIIIPPGTPAVDIQAVINAASPGDVIVLPAETIAVPGGFSISTPGITIVLSDGTVIQASSPCFVVTASDTTITGGGTCTPTGGSSGIVVDTAVSNLVISGIEIDGSSTTGSGIWINKAVNNLQILNNYIHNLGGDGITYTATGVVTGVHEVQGNLFQNNAGFGVNNASANPYIVEYNSWGDLGGPNAGSGDGANGLLDFTPWTHVGLSVSYSAASSPVANKVGEGYQIAYNIKMDAAEVFGADFDLNFDSTKLSVVSASNGGSFTQRDLCTINTATPGVVSFCGSRTPLITALNGSAQPVFTVVFQGLAASAPGSVALDLDATDDTFGMAPPGGASNNIYAAALNGGSLTVYNTTTVTGRVDLQGRANDTGAVMTFAAGTSVGYGSFVSSTSTYFGPVSLSSVVWDTYPVTVSMARYLDVTVASGRIAAITSDNQVLSTLVLLGGDANDDNIIDISDAAIIGGQFGTDGSGDVRSDINNDGTVDISDLVLMGGNYGKTSAAGPDAAYAAWTP